MHRNNVLRKLFGRFKIRGLVSDAMGSQLVEFAFLLPFLLVFVAGIIDFGQAFNLRQKLNNAAREGARLAASENTLDLNCGSSCTPAPSSVQAVREAIANYLTSARVTDCAVGTTSAYSATNQTWTYSSSSAGCSNFSLKIERGYTYPDGANTVAATRVTLNYPYTWVLFSRIIRLLASGSNYGTSVTITTDAIMRNLT